MLQIFKKNKKYTDEELMKALKKDNIAVTEQEIQKAKENDAKILFKIGEAYFENNKKKSFAWYYKSALQYHDEAQAQVGYMYQWGKGVSQDYDLAMLWLKKAASKDNGNAQYNIGDLYAYGYGVPANDTEAMNWYMKAATNGNINGIYHVGHSYRHGYGVPKNIQAAIEWYTKAANQSKEAQNELGEIYAREVEFKNLQNAVTWYQKAAENGYPWAKEKVHVLNKFGYYAEQQKDLENDEKSSSDRKKNRFSPSAMVNDRLQSFIDDLHNEMTLVEIGDFKNAIGQQTQKDQKRDVDWQSQNEIVPADNVTESDSIVEESHHN